MYNWSSESCNGIKSITHQELKVLYKEQVLLKELTQKELRYIHRQLGLHKA